MPLATGLSTPIQTGYKVPHREVDLPVLLEALASSEVGS